ncbi:MAG: aromatic ring-hydroxylating dioxygenase subunit alpha [Paracoccaceae bacterium]|nr:aromatic ring-hydroxylating dioxygenase subunit alpha [Paracoccaceae bacterium]
MTELPAEIAEALAKSAASDHAAARAMPGAFYTCPDVLAAERAGLFAREWLCVGRAEEIPEPGDYMTYDLVGEPVAMVRGEDGAIRALSNVCRHRAMPVLSGQGKARRLVCPYHSWTYDTTGQLIGTPLIGKRADFDKRDCRLPEFRSEIWQGFIFVSLNPDVAPLAPRMAGLDRIIHNYHFEEMRTRYVAHEVWDTNWKSLVENFMEGYHLSALHRETLHLVNPTELCAHYPAGDAYFGSFAGFTPDMEREKVGHPDLTEAELDTCVMIAVPPNLVIGGASDYSSFLCIEPASTDSVRVKLGLFFYGDDWPDERVDWAVELFQNTMAEDKVVLENLGRGLRSAHYRPGPLAGAAYEGCILDLHQYIARRLGLGVGAA